jgi:hypothetical protein
MMAIDQSDPGERRARIENIIEEYRAVKQRKLLRLAIRRWRTTAARQRLDEFESRPERVH